MFGHSPSHITKASGFVAVCTLTFLGVYSAVWHFSHTSTLVHVIAPSQEVASANVAIATSSATSTKNSTAVLPISTTSVKMLQATSTPKVQKATVAKAITATKASITPTSTVQQVGRIQNPYPTSPLSFDAVNTSTRGALVDIFCQPRDGSFDPISGSGVIIDSRGIILTNAHVAQYVLLSESANVDLTCTIRTGSPATARYTAQVLYIPSVWVNLHAAEINTSHPMGTGEHDYALLYINGSVDGSPLPTSFPTLLPDTRERIAFLGDSVLGAGYPAEFIGGAATESSLYAVSSVSSVSQLLTFGTNTVDAISIGSVIEAQSGSSGGAVVNAWGRLVGIIATTSAGPTTAQRELRAVTLSYINRDLLQQSGQDLPTLLAGDPASEVADFTTNTAPNLIKQYIQILSK